MKCCFYRKIYIDNVILFFFVQIAEVPGIILKSDAMKEMGNTFNLIKDIITERDTFQEVIKFCFYNFIEFYDNLYLQKWKSLEENEKNDASIAENKDSSESKKSKWAGSPQREDNHHYVKEQELKSVNRKQRQEL